MFTRLTLKIGCQANSHDKQKNDSDEIYDAFWSKGFTIHSCMWGQLILLRCFLFQLFQRIKNRTQVPSSF